MSRGWLVTRTSVQTVSVGLVRSQHRLMQRFCYTFIGWMAMNEDMLLASPLLGLSPAAQNEAKGVLKTVLIRQFARHVYSCTRAGKLYNAVDYFLQQGSFHYAREALIAFCINATMSDPMSLCTFMTTSRYDVLYTLAGSFLTALVKKTRSEYDNNYMHNFQLLDFHCTDNVYWLHNIAGYGTLKNNNFLLIIHERMSATTLEESSKVCYVIAFDFHNSDLPPPADRTVLSHPVTCSVRRTREGYDDSGHLLNIAQYAQIRCTVSVSPWSYYIPFRRHYIDRNTLMQKAETYMMEAFCMASVVRLGAHSQVATLNSEIMRMIVSFVRETMYMSPSGHKMLAALNTVTCKGSHVMTQTDWIQIWALSSV